MANKIVANKVFKMFYTDGQLASTLPYVNGKKEGEALFYYPEGGLERRLHYKQGELHGKQEYFYKTGKKKTVLQYKLGVLVKAVQYHADGKIKRQVTAAA